MRLALLALLLAAFTQAHAQRGVLMSPLPEDLDTNRALDVTRQVLVARGWTLVPEDRSSIEAEKDRFGLRIFVEQRSLRFNDLSQRGRGARQRNREDRPNPYAAVTQDELDGLRADLAAALAGKPPVAGVSSPRAPGQLLIGVPAGADPKEVMDAARAAFVGRRWDVKENLDGAFVANIRGATDSANLKVFFADGALWFIDRSTDRRGAKTQVPERWLNNVRADLRQPLGMLGSRASRAKLVPQEPAASDAAQRLSQLKTLLDRGLITQAEYDAKRAEILKGL